MDIEIKTWLYDILKPINEIESFLIGSPKIFQNFQDDLLLRRAIERNIEIIGEAVNRILRKNENIQITDSRRIVDVRNRIIHGYDSVSEEILWAIVIRYLPILQSDVEKLLGE